MNILDKIVHDKYKEVEARKALISTKQLEQKIIFDRQTISLTQRIRSDRTGIIAEFKRRSPSKSVINEHAYVHNVAEGFEKAGVSGMSVLTDFTYFGGSLEDLLVARNTCKLPLLRKEFVIDEYQIIEAKSWGADVILLIAAVLSKEEIKKFSELAQSLNLEVLLEVHNLEELHRSIMPSLNMIGVNNRNLKSFEVDLNTSKMLSHEIPKDFIKVSESGISSIEAIKELKKYDYQGFLIGENFMKTNNPGGSAAQFIIDLNHEV